jgi:hypothetical protein
MTLTRTGAGHKEKVIRIPKISTAEVAVLPGLRAQNQSPERQRVE